MGRNTALGAMCAVALTAPCFSIAGQTPAIIPREMLFGNPAVDDVRISPNGNLIAYLAPVEGVMNVCVRRMSDVEGVAVTDSSLMPVHEWRWAENSEQILFMRDDRGDEQDHLFAATIDFGADIGDDGTVTLTPIGSTVTELTPYPGVRTEVIAGSHRWKDEILIEINHRDRSVHDVWRVNTRTGEHTVILQNTRGYYEFLADSSLELRLAIRMTASGGIEVDARNPEDGSWRVLGAWSAEEATNSRPLGISADGRTFLFADSRHSDRARLYALSTDDLGNTSYLPIAIHEVGELQEVMFHSKSGLPIAARFERSISQWVTLDDQYLEDFRNIHAGTSGHFRVTSRGRADRYWIVESQSDTQPPIWSLYDRQTGTLEVIAESRPWLNRFDLAPTETVNILSRDGLELVCYLTRPLRMAEPLPMVLWVHGGPWSRDHWGFDPRRQWLANRGYAVLNVNYRGSVGFGKAFAAAGDREWAGAMHDDLIDACLWAIDQGIADPQRIAIMGGSYGGYAALVGLAFTPDFFAAGVSFAGPSNVNTLLNSIPEYWEPRRAQFETRVGPTDNPSYLESISPLSRAGEIVRPLLIAHGANDPRVKQQEAEQIVEALRSNGNTCTYLLFPDEGHGILRPENRNAFFALTEEFLAEQLNGRVEAAGNVVDRSSVQVTR